MSKQVVIASYTAYVEYVNAQPDTATDASGQRWSIGPVDYKTWAKWMATP